MNAVMVDTDVVSMLFKGDSRAERYRGHIGGRLLAISFMTLAELERWPLERSWGPLRRGELSEHLKRYVVLPASRELGVKWAEVSCASEGSSDPDGRRLGRRERDALRSSADHE